MQAGSGNGVSVSAKAKSDMEVSSLNSPKNDKKPTTKISEREKKSVTKEEACTLLASAIAYCNEAGFIISGRNHDLSLRLQIDGMNYLGDKFVVVTEVTTNSTEGNDN